MARSSVSFSTFKHSPSSYIDIPEDLFLWVQERRDGQTAPQEQTPKKEARSAEDLEIDASSFLMPYARRNDSHQSRPNETPAPEEIPRRRAMELTERQPTKAYGESERVETCRVF
ncbi:hypothetical protein Y1Q_0010783 [Alligator mississippiensis]|uniref:Uncharacterized protein n=1 Tax=Alligator mississippiensis TaxID=8496 RepID=A0A151M714_ALLMI|nr:hypothetical protein Y1Q_0010783 [Alligator mississippiensis]